MPGSLVLLGGDAALRRMIRQIPGSALAMKREDFGSTITDWTSVRF